MTRRPALDGLRALAVLAVMAFHTSPAAHGGFLGVDVFFVVSGFLITALLLAERARTGRIDLRAFYLRRLLRLGPALLLMLVFAVPLMLTDLRETLGAPAAVAVLGAVFYVANWMNVAESEVTGPLTHTWSLSIEEQFYLIWPALLLVWLVRRGRPPVTGLVLAIAAVVVSRWVLWDTTHGMWLYYATTSHADGLLVGSLLAVFVARRTRAAGPDRAVPRWSEPAAWAGLAGLAALAAWLHIDDGATYEVGLALAAVFSALVVHHLGTADSGPLVRLLSLRPLVAIGAVSYGLYLFHFPVFQAVQHAHLPHLIQHVLELSFTALLTVISWFLVEKPALRLKERIVARRPATTPATPAVSTAP